MQIITKIVIGMCASVAITAHAQQLNPLATPNGVTAHIVDQDVCVGVEHNLRVNPRNVFAQRRVYGVMWYMNSRGEYVSFSCWHTNMTQRVPQSMAVMYTASKTTLDAAALEELQSASAALTAKQNKIRNSGFE